MKNLAPAIFPPKGIGDTKPSNKAVLDWVNEIATLTEPENVFWCDGSEGENKFLIAESLKQNVLTELNDKKVPHSYLHRSSPNDVARVEQFTFICTPTKQEVGPTRNLCEASGIARGRDARAHDVRHSVHHGPGRFADGKDRLRDHRFEIC